MSQRMSRREFLKWVEAQPRGRLASVQHYLLVRPTRREIVHHRRVADGILTQIVHEGVILLDPPGIRLTLDEIYAA
jgi:Uma2 family endonuclease